MTDEQSRKPATETPADVQTLRDWAALTISGFLVALFGILWTLTPSRFLSSADFADFTAGASLIYFVAMALGPLSQTIAHITAVTVARGETAGGGLRALERRLLLYCLVGLIVFAPLSPLLRDLLHFRTVMPLWIVYAVAAILTMGAIRRGFVQGQARFGAFSANITLEAVLRFAALLIACLLVPGATGSLTSYAVAAAIALALLPLPPSETAEFPSLLRYFSLAFGATLIYSAFLTTDVLLVKFFFPPDDAALYGAASFIGRGAGMLVAPFYVYAVPRLAGPMTASEIRMRFTRLCLGFLALEIISIASLFILRRPIVAVLLGPHYAQAADLVLPISIAVAIGGFTFIASQLPAARARFDFIPWYAVGYTINVVAIVLWHESLWHVVAAVIGAQLLTLLLVAPKIARTLRTP